MKTPLGSSRNWLCLGLALALTAAVTQVGRAAPLAPGGFIAASGESDPIGGTILFTTNVSFSTTSFAGVLTSTVLTGDTSNPFGSGRVTFTYELSLTSGPDPSSGLTIGSFNGFQTDVSYQTPVIGLAPGFISRSSMGNQAINFNFSSVGYLIPGANSALLVVQTDGTAWDFGTSTVSDDNGSANITSLVPGTTYPVPEPTAATFCILGLGTLISSWRLRQGRQI